MPDFPFDGSISQAILQSKKDVAEFTMMNKKGQNINLVVEGAEFLNLILAVNMRILEYIQEKTQSLENFNEEDVIMNLFNKFHRITKQLE